jgi:hypothetical protein
MVSSHFAKGFCYHSDRIGSFNLKGKDELEAEERYEGYHFMVS